MKLVLLSLVSLFFRNYYNVNLESQTDIVGSFFKSLCDINKEFENSIYKKPIKLIDSEDKNVYFYKTYLDNKYTGFFILDSDYNFIGSSTSSDDLYLDIKDGYYFNSIFDISDNRTYKNNHINFIDTYSFVNNETLPNVSESVYHPYSSAYGSSLTINNVPTYYNGIGYDNFPGGGCTPTAGTMFLSFYDRYCDYYNSLYNPNLPLNHDDNLNYVNKSIIEMGTYMKTIVKGQEDENNPLGSTKDYMISIGINNLLNDKNLNDYKMKYVDTIKEAGSKTENGKTIKLYSANTDMVSLYSSSLISSRNIAILTIESDYASGNYLNTDHAVILTGYDSYKYGQKIQKSLRVN